MSHFRFAFRQLLKNPGFTTVAVLTLALGVGVNATVFGMMDALFLRPFQFPDYQRIVVLWETVRGDGTRDVVAPATFLDWRRQSTTVDPMAAWEAWDANLTGAADPERLQGFQVSQGFFGLFGVQLEAGRTFSPDEETSGNAPSLVIGHGLWSSRFGGDPGTLGSTIEVNGEPHLIVGIAPKGFDFPVGAQIWAPLTFDTQRAVNRTQRSLTVAGKLVSSRSIADAQAEMAVISRQLEQQHPEVYRDRLISVRSLSRAFREESSMGLFGTLLAAAGLVLLAACMNVVALLLARGIDRRRELALRTALGATRSDILRQLVTETAVLGIVSSLVALMFAGVSLGLLRSSLPAEITMHIEGWNNLGLNPVLICVIPPLALLVGVLAGVAPAIASSRGNMGALKEAGRGAVRTPSRQRIRQVMVATEIAFALALLVVAGLAVAGGIRLVNQPGGFDAQRLLTFHVPLPEGKYVSDRSRDEFASELLSRVETLPAVEQAASANILPASGWNPSVHVIIDGQPISEPGHRPRTGYRSVSPAFFEALRIPVLRGRAFTSADDADSMPVAMISASVAERFWPDQDPIGKRLQVDDREEWLTVVGVAGDVSMYNWWDGVDHSAIYRPLGQAPAPQTVQVAVRTRGDPALAIGSLRSTLHAIDPLLPMDNVRTMRQAIDQARRGLSWMGWLLGICGGIGALLAVLGIYGVMAYSMSQREHEFGVRMALGATRRDVLRLTLKQAATLTGAGVTAGVLLAWLFGRAMESSMTGVISLHVGTFLIVTPGLALIALAAAYFPARRALALDPAVILRSP